MGPQAYSIVMSSTHLIEIDKKSGEKAGHMSLLFCSDDSNF